MVVKDNYLTTQAISWNRIPDVIVLLDTPSERIPSWLFLSLGPILFLFSGDYPFRLEWPFHLLFPLGPPASIPGLPGGKRSPFKYSKQTHTPLSRNPAQRWNIHLTARYNRAPDSLSHPCWAGLGLSFCITRGPFKSILMTTTKKGRFPPKQLVVQCAQCSNGYSSKNSSLSRHPVPNFLLCSASLR